LERDGLELDPVSWTVLTAGEKLRSQTFGCAMRRRVVGYGAVWLPATVYHGITCDSCNFVGFRLV
jgi:hypothetical protein